MADNTQHKIGRNRSPRVQITYDVEIGNAIEKQEIPFVVGIMADLSAHGANPQVRPALKHASRSFVEIDRDNFGDVMAKLSPSLPVAGALDADGKAATALHFTSLDDFSPANLVKRIGPIAALYNQRSALRDILTKLDSNDEFHEDLKKRVKAGNMAALGSVAGTRLTALTAPGGGSETPPEPPQN